MKGSAEIKIGGQVRPLKFGTNQTILFCKSQGITLNELDEVYGNIQVGNTDGSAIRDLLFSGLYDGARVKKMPQDFDAETVGDWLEDCPKAEVKKAFEALRESMPNHKKESKKKK